MRGRRAFVAAPRGRTARSVHRNRKSCGINELGVGCPGYPHPCQHKLWTRRAPSRDHSTGAAPAASLAIQSRNSVIAGVSGFDFSDVSQ